MEQQKSSHIIKKILKILGYSFLGVLLLVIGLHLSLKTNVVHNFVKNKVVEIASESLQPKLTIGAIKGDLWKEIELTQVHVGENDSIIYVDTLYANYSVLSILSGRFEVNKLKIAQAQINVKEQRINADSSVVFNVQELLVPDTTAEESSSSFGFSIDNIILASSSIYVHSKTMLPDTTIALREIEAEGAFVMDDEIEGSISKLSFNIKEGRLPESIALKAEAEYKNEKVTLQDLIINTGRSMLKVQGFADLKDSVANVDAHLNPLDFADIIPYLEANLAKEEIEISIHVSGNTDKMRLQISGNGSFVQEVDALAEFSLSQNIEVTKVELSAKNLDLATLTNDSVDVKTKSIYFSADGNIGPNYEHSELEWDLNVENLSYQKYAIQHFVGNGSLKNGELIAHFEATSPNNEKVKTIAKVEHVFSEYPVWNVGFNLNDLNAENWTEEAPKTNISLNGFITGEGFTPSKETWKYAISNDRIDSKIIEVKDETIKDLGFKSAQNIQIQSDTLQQVLVYGTLNIDSLTTNALVHIYEGELQANASVTNYMNEIASYNYQLSTSKLDISALSFAQDFPTSINLKVEGLGAGLDMETMWLNGSVNVDTSYVNGAQIQFIKQNFALDNGILKISEAELKSEIADATFSGRKNLMDEKDPENILLFNLDIKNTQPFAPLAELEVLQVEGLISAEIKENNDGILECNLSLGLQNILADNLFAAEEIKGDASAILKDKTEGSFELDIIKPIIFETKFQDISIGTKSNITEDSLNGQYSIVVIDDREGRIENEGNYDVLLDSLQIALTMNKLNIEADEGGLNLQNTFNISYKNGVIKTDSLALMSPNGAHLSLAIPYADSLQQEVWFVAERFDFGILQEITFDEKYIDGVLSGNLNINKTKNKLDGTGKIQLQNIWYDGAEADEFRLEFEAKESRLTSTIGMTWDGIEYITGYADVPLDLNAPETLSDEFFKQKVDGSLTVKPLELSRFKDILSNFGITGTEGLVSFNSTLSGTAGKPNLEGALKVIDPKLSNVPLDSLIASFDYSQINENIIISAELKAAKQKAADIEVNLPFSYDFKTFEVNTVQKNKPVSATIKTTDFNLAVFNDFLDKEMSKNLKGRLNGQLDVEGTENSITADGYFDLTNSSVEVPILGIKIDDIKSRIEFEDGKIILQNLNAKSGKGQFSAQGDINLDGLYPTNVDIEAKANQFKAANTDEYNLVVDLNSKIEGPIETPKATGKLSVKNGFIVLDNFGDKSVEEVQLEGEETEPISMYDSLAVDMEFAIERNFFVRNRRYLDMELEISGRLDALKETNGDLSLFGTLNGDGGYLRPLGKRFELDEAEVTFSGEAANPNLNIRSSYVPLSRKGEQEVTLYYIVKGRVDDPKFNFESDPPMEKQDIVCYTVFNRPCYALDSWQNALTSQGGSSPADLLAGALIDEIEALATRELGVDVVQIDNTRVGNETGTTVKTGWYLNDRTFFAIVNEITSSDPKTLFILEYALSKTWDMIITEGEDQNQRGLDFKWQIDY